MTPTPKGNKGEDDPARARFARYLGLDSGLFSGALVLTLDGEKRVEELTVSDKVITRDSGVAKLVHIQRIERHVPRIAFCAGALGDNRPEEHVSLAADQMVLIRDWRARTLFNCERALVAARTLVDDKTIVHLDSETLTLHQIFCDTPHVLFCDGLELATADGARARGSVLHAA